MKERMNERLNDRQAAISAAQAQSQGTLPNSSVATDVTNNTSSASIASSSVTGNHNSTLPLSDGAPPPSIPTATPMSSINVARRMPTASILQATLSAPPVNNSTNSSSAPAASSSLQQLPIHPVPQSTVIRQIITPNVPTGPPPGVLQTQLTIQTNNITSNSVGANHNQTTVMLPLTPHPNPHSASSSSLASPLQQLPSTPVDGQGSIAVPPSNILPSPLNVAIEQTSNNTNIINNNSSAVNNTSANALSGSANSSSNGSENHTGNSDQMAISAIMESLMKDTAQFEADKKHHQFLQSPQQPQSPLIANSSVVAINSNNTQPQTLNASGTHLIGGAQLPTCPVPQASLAEAGVVTSPAKQSSLVGGNPNQTTNQTSNRVSIQNLLNAQIQQQPVALRQIQQHPSATVSPNVKVTLSQLAAQLQRPTSVVASVASVSLPSYSQALAQTQQISPGQRLVLAQQPLTNPKLQRSNPQTPTSNIETSTVSNLLGGTITIAGKTLSQDAPGLQALLANTPSADNPCLQVNIGNNDLMGAVSGGSGNMVNANAQVPSSGTIGVSVGSGSLLEQLVKGQAITTIAISQGATNIVNSSVLSPIARSLPNPIATPVSTGPNILQSNQPNICTSALPADSTNDITLAGLLAKPITPGVSGIQHQNQNTVSPAKMSPLLQQLQQPIPPPRPITNSSLPSPRQPVPGITSPRRPPTTPSPSRTNQSQQPTRSPRPSPTNFSLQQQSPRAQQGNLSVLQQQLMQQSNKQPNSILSTQLQQPLNLPASQVPIPVQELISGSNNNINVNSSSSGGSSDISNHSQHTALNGVVGNGSQHQQNQVVSLQNLLQSGVVQVSNVASSGTYLQQVTPAINTQAGSATASIPVQLSIPGLSAPVTLSVNLPASSIASVPSGSAPNETAAVNNSMNSVIVGNNSVLLANQGSLLGQQGIATQQKTVTVSNVGGKYVANNHSSLGLTASSSGGVFLQGSTGNIIHLPQQPQQISTGALGNASAGSIVPTSLSAVANIIKPIVSIDSQAAGVANIGTLQSNQMLKSISVSAVPTSGTIGSQVLQMRQTQSGQQVYVQVPNSGVSASGASPQSIQIVRSIPQGACNPQQQTIVHTVQPQSLRPPSLPPPSPQQQLVSLNSALKSPVGLQTLSPQMVPPQSPLNNANLNVVMSPPTPQQQLMGMSDSNSLMLTSPGGSSGLNHSSPTVQHSNTAAAHMKIRTQRKQSLHNT